MRDNPEKEISSDAAKEVSSAVKETAKDVWEIPSNIGNAPILAGCRLVGCENWGDDLVLEHSCKGNQSGEREDNINRRGLELTPKASVPFRVSC